MQRFLSLGAKCVKIQETADASQGISFVLWPPAFYFYVLVLIFLMVVDVSLFFCIIVALTTARARISALEAELKASVEAWESANATKVSAEKTAKSAESRAKKAEKALADTHQKQAKREQSVAERLDKISVSVSSKCHITPFLDTYLGFHLLVCVYIFCLCLCGIAKKIGESWRLQQPNTEDPLLVVVDMLESNWRLVQNILQRVRHVLIRLFPRLFPKKKKNEIPADNLRRLVKSFDTIEDHVCVMKLISIKRGVEGAIALAQVHGEVVNREKVCSYHARPLSEMLEFFKKAKQYAPNIVTLISPSAASSTSAPRSMEPPSSSHVTDDSVPSTATEPAAEVA
jgi:hypothetical protein